MPAARLIQTLLPVLLSFALGGCGQLGYYTQSVIGHSQLMLARQDVSRAIEKAEANGDQALIDNLRLAVELRQFAIERLQLPDNGSYRNYVALQRDFPVWTVVAADEFSVDAHQWCYLIIGCASYRGYFKQARAEAFALTMQQQGYDTTVGGAIAYSTLGWFRDPLLPSMFRQGEAQFAEILFHELAHQVLYVKGASDFNEAFATVVGEQGARMWLHEHRPNLLAEYQNQIKAYRQFVQLLLRAREELRSVYASDASADEMRARKKSVFDQLIADYQRIKAEQWSGAQWFDGWFATPVNNARLSAVATYYEQVPQLLELLANCNDDYGRFYASLKANVFADAPEIPTRC